MKDIIKRYYDYKADSYNQQFYIEKNMYPTLMYRHNYILDMLDEEKLSPDAKILDAGCGPGELVMDLAKRGFEVYGIDISGEMIGIAQEKVDGNEYVSNINLSVGDIERLNFEDNYFDAVILAGVIEYLESDDLWIAEVERVLKPNGRLIVNVTNSYAIRRWTLPFFDKLKSSPVVRKIFNNIKKSILKKGEIEYFPFRPRSHSPKNFDLFLHEHGFEKKDHRYFDFCVFPYPVDTILGLIVTPLRKKMEHFSSNNMYLWGTGYITCAKRLW